MGRSSIVGNGGVKSAGLPRARERPVDPSPNRNRNRNRTQQEEDMTMRITIHLSTFDELNPCAYAIVWIDRDARKWSRESHFGLDLPTWGIVTSQRGVTRLCSPRADEAICELTGFDLGSDEGPFEGETGGAQLCGVKARGHWPVQCVDEEATLAENSVFADDESI